MNSKFNIILFPIIICFVSFPLFSQQALNFTWDKHTRQDTLRGMLTPLRTCFDVTYYNLDVKIDPTKRSVEGKNRIQFKVVEPFQKMQIDLFPNMKVEKILFEDGSVCEFSREFGAVFITLPKILEKDSEHFIDFYYSGNPQVAKRPPWDGGFTWTDDKEGNPWACVTCQGTGASLWWPNKDHQSDEPDSMLLSVTVPSDLQDVSNGRLRSKDNLGNGWIKYNWFISSPINNYNVTFNIGKFAHFSDTYTSKDGQKLSLDYYVMPENLDKAKTQFKNANKMLTAFEYYFGKYPFYKDGYKLIEAPHNGMEHQSAIAYGNNYWNGYVGRSSSSVGLNFDFIIVHESAHEWWGNNVTSNDVADMWVHESFGAYAEGLFVEYYCGHEEAMKYINGKGQIIKNDKPIIGPFNVNKSGSGDMYNKGQLVLNTLRSVIDNDSLWFSILSGIQKDFYHNTVDGTQIFNYINEKTGKNFDYFYDQYFKRISVPELIVMVTQKGDTTNIRYKWKTDVDDFKMPVKVTTKKNKFEFIYPTDKWNSLNLKDFDPSDFEVAEDLFYLKSSIIRQYIDPQSTIKIK